MLIECVPNISEGRRADVIELVAAAIRSIPGVTLLDYSSDADHNRSVFTFAGEADAVVEAAYQTAAAAARLIDMDVQSGTHPRIGAVDVIPFVPLAGATLDDCIELACNLGQRIGRELAIPVYLYEAAATSPERVNLANIRRGEYEGLKSTIGNDPDRQPDFGPSQIGKAGAVAIGARQPLIAFNVFLASDNVEIAKKVAEAVRHSSGGLRSVKALGMLVNGRAQVSLTLNDHNDTPLHRAVELIRREAARYGVMIERTELIGLIPQKALLDAAAWYLQLDGFHEGQVLETRIAGLT